MHAILVALAVALAVHTAEGVPNTADGIFQEAIGNWGSSSSDAAMVTIVDTRIGHEQLVCVEVDVLGSAFAIEHEMKWWPGFMNHITERMRLQRDRRFVFTNEEALHLLGKSQGYAEFDAPLCDFIRKDIYAFRGDRPPTLYVGKLRNL